MQQKELRRPMQDLEAVRSAFVEPWELWSSPLYRQISGAADAAIGSDGSLHRIIIEHGRMTVTGRDGLIYSSFDVEVHLAWARPSPSPPDERVQGRNRVEAQ